VKANAPYILRAFGSFVRLVRFVSFVLLLHFVSFVPFVVECSAPPQSAWSRRAVVALSVA